MEGIKIKSYFFPPPVLVKKNSGLAVKNPYFSKNNLNGIWVICDMKYEFHSQSLNNFKFYISFKDCIFG